MPQSPTSHADLSSTHAMDTGYSWLVMVSSFLVLFIVFGQLLNFGIYFVVFSQHFESSKESTALVGGLCCALLDLSGPVAGILQRRFGARAVIMTGALLASLGMALSYFATQLWHLYLTYGCLCGLGYGLCVTPSMAVLPEYFEKHRYFVTSCASMGAALGSWIFAPLNLLLIETYTWRGSMLIQAGFSLQVLILGAVCKSRILHRRVSLSSLFDTAIFRDPRFFLLVSDGAVLGGTSFTVFSMINSFIIGRGLTTWQSAELVSVAGAGGMVAKILIVFISHLKCTDRTLLYSLMSLTLGIGVGGCVFCYDFVPFALALSVFGFSVGAKFSQVANVVMDLFGVDKVVIGLGYFSFFLGLGDLLLPFLAGWLADQTEIQYAFAMTAVTCGIGFSFCCALLFMRRRRKVTEPVAEGEDYRDRPD